MFNVSLLELAMHDYDNTNPNETYYNLQVTAGYSHLSDIEAPIIPTNSKAPEIPTVFWLGSCLSDSKKGPW